MEIGRELLFFFSALGAFNGLLMGLYFILFAKPRHLSNYFLGALLLSLSIRIGKSVFFYFNPDLAYHYLQLGLTSCFFIGPFLYFYIKTIVDPNGKIHRNWIYHMAILVPTILMVGYLYPFAEYVDLWRAKIIYSIYFVWLGYSIAASYVAKPIFKKLFDKSIKLKSIELWMISLIIGNSAILAAYFLVGITSYILGALLFSFMLYLLFLLLLFSKKKDSILFKGQTKHKTNKLKNEQADELLERLRNVMEGNELYKNPNLKLADIAKKLNVLPHTISQLLNDHLGQSFPHFLNEYRIEEAKKLILSNHENTFEALGYDSGFNSKSTFFATFKKFTGTTPAKYKAQQQEQNT